MTRPRVTARHEIDALSTRVLCEPNVYTSPRALVSVDFDLHDHKAALDALDAATARVKAQIEETA